jgi:hypothetical protein
LDWAIVLIWNSWGCLPSPLPTFLRGVVFVGEAALRQRFDFSASACSRKAAATRSSWAFFAFAKRAATLHGRRALVMERGFSHGPIMALDENLLRALYLSRGLFGSKLSHVLTRAKGQR